ncbi:MAG TPA: hypothetical protein VH352_00520, partial [Pseudonocardiaceae bacterium]|nr:hypothetical protein [Pseudonocardiaceae bacterium]
MPVRRLTRLDADYYATPRRKPTRSAPPARPPVVTPSSDRDFLRLLERAVGGWAPTLRQSVALLALFLAAAVAVVITLGIGGLLLVCGLGLALK